MNPKTTASGILAIILSTLGLFGQIMNGLRGGTIDAQATASAVGGIVAGVGLVAAKDADKK